MFHQFFRRFVGIVRLLRDHVRAVIVGTILGFIISLCSPLVKPAAEILKPYYYLFLSIPLASLC